MAVCVCCSVAALQLSFVILFVVSSAIGCDYFLGRLVLLLIVTFIRAIG